MSTYLLSIGINHYTDHAFKTLSCCENDATNIHEVFKRDLRLGERARKLVGAVSLAQVKAELREIGREIRNGDTFVFFFSGHGYQHPKCEDQYLLFPEAEAVLVNKGHRDGMLSLTMLCDLTEHWAGVAQVPDAPAFDHPQQQLARLPGLLRRLPSSQDTLTFPLYGFTP